RSPRCRWCRHRESGRWLLLGKQACSSCRKSFSARRPGCQVTWSYMPAIWLGSLFEDGLKAVPFDVLDPVGGRRQRWVLGIADHGASKIGDADAAILAQRSGKGPVDGWPDGQKEPLAQSVAVVRG